MQALDQSSLKELDEKLAKVTQEASEVASKVLVLEKTHPQVSALESENKQLSSEPTDKDIDKILAETKAKHAELTSRLEKIRASAGNLDGKQKVKLEEKYNKTKKEWRSRKRKVCYFNAFQLFGVVSGNNGHSGGRDGCKKV